MGKATKNFLQGIFSLVCWTHGLQHFLHVDPSNGNLDMLIKERDFLVCTGGGLDGCGVGVGVASLSDELKSSEDEILIGSFGVKDLCPTYGYFVVIFVFLWSTRVFPLLLRIPLL